METCVNKSVGIRSHLVPIQEVQGYIMAFIPDPQQKAVVFFSHLLRLQEKHYDML